MTTTPTGVCPNLGAGALRRRPAGRSDARVGALQEKPARARRPGAGRTARLQRVAGAVARPLRSGTPEPHREARTARRQVPARADEFGPRYPLPRDLTAPAWRCVVGVLSSAIALAAAAPRRRRRFAGGWLDAVMNARARDPPRLSYLLLALAIVAALGTGTLNTTIAVGIWGVPAVTRIVAARCWRCARPSTWDARARSGAPPPALLAATSCRNIVPGLIVYGTLFMANAIFAGGRVVVPGPGRPAPTASWGLMVSTGRDVLLVAPHVATVRAWRSWSPCWPSTWWATASATRSTRACAAASEWWCAPQAVAGLGPRRPRCVYKWWCAPQAVAGLWGPAGRVRLQMVVRAQAVAGLGPRRPRRVYKSCRPARCRIPEQGDGSCRFAR